MCAVASYKMQKIKNEKMKTYSCYSEIITLNT